MVIFRNKKQTDYQLVTEYGKTILHARAASASSGLMQHVNIDSVTQPWLSWRWWDSLCSWRAIYAPFVL